MVKRMKINLDNQKQIEDIENERILSNFQKWQQRLQEYVKQIENNSFDELNIEKLLNDVYFCEYYDYFGLSEDNEYNSTIKKLMPKLATQIAKYYSCQPSDICFGSYNLDVKTEKFPYAVVLGNVFLFQVNLNGVSKLNDVSKLKVVSGTLLNNCSKITIFPNLVYAKRIKTFYTTSFPSLIKTYEIKMHIAAGKQIEIDLSKLQKVDDYLRIDNVFVEGDDCENPIIRVKLDSLRECLSLDLLAHNICINSLDNLKKCRMLDVKKATIKSMKNLTEVECLEIDDTKVENMPNNLYINNNLTIKYHDLKRDKGDINELIITKNDEKIIEKINSVGGEVLTPVGKFAFDEIKEKVIKSQ